MRIEELETPSVVVDLDVVERNLRRAGDYIRQHHLQLRPHTKTHKIPALARMQIEAGAYGVTVAKVGEAEVMAEGGIENILLAYPVFGESKWDRLAVIARERSLTMALDSPATVEGLAASMRRAGAKANVLVEFDAGMHRCGVQTAAEAATLAAQVDRTPGLRFAGILFYPGHIWNRPEEQGPALAAIGAQIREIAGAIQAQGLDCEVVSGGSTPTLYQSHLVPGLTEIRPGTFIFNDRNEWGGGFCSLDDCALRVLVTVVSNAVPERAIVDGGSKTFSGDGWISGDRKGYGYVVERPEASLEALTEEHGHLRFPAGAAKPRVGERLSIIPNHVCACVNMHDEIFYHRGGVVEGSWKVAGRGRVR